MACGKVSLLGWDIVGRPVLLIQAKKHSVWSRKIEETKSFCCYILDVAVRATERRRHFDIHNVVCWN